MQGSLKIIQHVIQFFSLSLRFPVADSRQEAALMPNARFIPIPSIWGHFAGGRGINPADVQFLDDQLKLLPAS